MNQITLCEVGPRDGIQNEKLILDTDTKVALIEAQVQAGFRVVEVGSFVSPKAVPQTADTDEVFRRLDAKPGVEYRALIANQKGVERAIACGCKKVKMNVSASETHNLKNLGCTPAESVARFDPCVKLALENGIGISGSISMAFGSPWDREISPETVCSIIDAYVAAGITEISLSDASGQAFPLQVERMAAYVTERYPQVLFWLHFHNTRGLACANIMAGLRYGITHFDTAFAGLGGCPFVPGASGNISTEDVVHMCLGCGIETGIDLDAVLATGARVREIFGHSDSSVLKAGRYDRILTEERK